MSFIQVRPLVQAQPVIQWEPGQKPWLTAFAQNAFDINAWIYVFHEAAHAVVAEVNSLIPTDVVVAWSGGGNSHLVLALAATAEHREVCAAGGAVTKIMHGQYGDIVSVLNSATVGNCTGIDRSSYVNQCGGLLADFDSEMARLEDEFRLNGRRLNELLNATACVLYDAWLAQATATGVASANPFSIPWHSLQQQRLQRFGT